MTALRTRLAAAPLVALAALGLTAALVPAPAQAAAAATAAAWTPRAPEAGRWWSLSPQVDVRPVGELPPSQTVSLATHPVAASMPVSLVVTFGKARARERTARVSRMAGSGRMTVATASCQWCRQLTVVIPGSAVRASRRVFALRAGGASWKVRIDGRMRVDSTLDTRLQITNATAWPVTVKLGAGCADPYSLLPITLLPGQSTAATGWCAFRSSDIEGALLLGNIITGYRQIDLFAGNPSMGWPWIEVDGVHHGFKVGESCAFNPQGQHVEATRGGDLSAAKDLQLTWVDSTTLPSC